MQKSWTVGSASGGRYPALEPIFYPSNKNIVAIVTALAIKVYQLNTKQVVAKIPLDATSVTQVLLSKDEQFFYIVYDNGSVDRLMDGNLERITLAKKIVKVINIDDNNRILALYTSDAGISLGSVHEETAKEFFSTSLDEFFTVSSNGEFFAFAKRDSPIELFHLSSRLTKTIARSRPNSSIAISNKGLVAAGAESGVIDVYYDEGVRSLKWHLEPVRALYFSLHDNYLISGGEERVLVFWQMDTDKQQFLPRLDGTITSVSGNSNSTLYAITLDDAQVLILGATDLLSRLQVSGVRTHYNKLPNAPEKEKKKRRKHANDTLSDFSTIYRIHPSTKNAYFVCSQKNGSLGSQLQVFNPIKDDQDAVINVASTIPTGKVRSEQQITDPQVTHLEFSPDGEVMVTVEVSKPPPIDALESQNQTKCTLKFWKYDGENKWTLKTKVVDPHGAAGIIAAVAANPTNRGEFCTASRTGEVRLWRLDRNAWTMRRQLVGGAQSLKPVGLAWSNDGSVLALGFDVSIKLLNAQNLSVHSQLPNVLGSRVRGLVFSGKYLVALAKSRLVVWDIVVAQQVWSIQVPSASNGSRLLAADDSGRIAIAMNFLNSAFQTVSRIISFNVGSPIPMSAVYHSCATSAVVNQSPGFSFVDVRGVLTSIGGVSAPLIPVRREPQPIISLYNPENDEEEMVDEEQTTKRLGINSFDNVFTDESTSLETLFERVMKVVG